MTSLKICMKNYRHKQNNSPRKGATTTENKMPIKEYIVKIETKVINVLSAKERYKGEEVCIQKFSETIAMELDWEHDYYISREITYKKFYSIIKRYSGSEYLGYENGWYTCDETKYYKYRIVAVYPLPKEVKEFLFKSNTIEKVFLLGNPYTRERV